MPGIDGSKAVLTNAGTIIVKLIDLLKDGVQFEDLGAILQDADLHQAIFALSESIKLVPGEVNDLDVFEGIRLGQHGYSEVQRIMDALQAKVA